MEFTIPLKLFFKKGSSLERILKENEFLIKNKLEKLIIGLGKREEKRKRVTYLFYIIGSKENTYEKALECIKGKKDGYYLIGLGVFERGKVKLRKVYFFEKRNGEVYYHELFKVNLYLNSNILIAYFDSNLNIRGFEVKRSKED